MSKISDESTKSPGAFDRTRLPVTEDIIRTVGLTTSFDRVTVLDNIEIAIRRGEVFVIMGPSGCGKTTLLRHLCGLHAPDQGTVRIAGQDIYQLSEIGMRDLRRCTGLSFQGGALLGGLTALENVALPLRENTEMPEELIRQIALMKLDMVDMLHAAELKPAKLSGGMKKRAAIARAMAMDPEIVFLDEPSAGLDPVTAVGVDNLISMLNRVFGVTMIVVTHDLESASVIADRAVVLDGGNVLVIGDQETVWGHPDASVQDFLLRRSTEEGGTKNDLERILHSAEPGESR